MTALKGDESVRQMTDMIDKTVFITGASRGIGRAIALKCAREGANVVVAAKTDQPHPKLSGTIHSVAQEITSNGGKALAIRLDVRDEGSIEAAMEQAAQRFDGIDALVNNASAIQLTTLQQTDLKRFDLIHAVNTRGVLACSKAAIPYLKASTNAHIITLAPPINLGKNWLGPYIPYTVTKYSMTLLTLGLAEELRGDGIAANTLWPQTTIATAAIENNFGNLMSASRTPEIMGDAAYEILKTPAGDLSGETLIDETLLRSRGVSDFEHYKYDATSETLFTDLYLDP